MILGRGVGGKGARGGGVGTARCRMLFSALLLRRKLLMASSDTGVTSLEVAEDERDRIINGGKA